MKKQQTFSLILAVSSALLASNAFAQTSPTTGAAQTPPAKTQSSSGAAAAKPQAGASSKKPGTAATAKPVSALPVLQTDRQKASYVIGTNIGRQLKQLGIDDIDSALLARGLKDFFAGAKSPLTDEQSQAALMAYAAEVKKRIEAKNQKEGETFLAANKAKSGVVTLPDGLQTKILTAGDRPEPKAESDVLACGQ